MISQLRKATRFGSVLMCVIVGSLFSIASGLIVPLGKYLRLTSAIDDAHQIYSFRCLFGIIYRQMLWRVKRYVDKMLT
jgi:hypothetical protein